MSTREEGEPPPMYEPPPKYEPRPSQREEVDLGDVPPEGFGATDVSVTS